MCCSLMQKGFIFDCVGYYIVLPYYCFNNSTFSAYHDHLSPVYTGIVIQIPIQIGCIYTEILIQTHLSRVDCDPDSNPVSGPSACVNAPIESCSDSYPPISVAS